MAPSACPEPKSWGELVNSYRSTFGSQSFSSVTDREQQVRYARSVPTVCPLAETKHPLYSTGAAGQHSINSQDGSAQRSQWHGWGNTTLLKEDGFDSTQLTLAPKRAQPHKPTGKKIVPAPCQEGRNGLFGLLQGTEAGGVDSWIGNIQIDPTKGKRAISPPTDPKRTAGMGQLLAQTAPGPPASDAWLGNIQIDPAKGKGHAPDPANTRGRADLFEIMQQKILWENREQHSRSGVSEAGRHSSGGSTFGSTLSGSGGSSALSSSTFSSTLNSSAFSSTVNSSTLGSSTLNSSTLSSSVAAGGSKPAADQDAWLGNRMIQPNTGKKPVDDSPAAVAHLHAATFKGGAPADGCWCDLPPIGKRPLSPPSNARNFVTAAQTMAIEMPLPPTAVLGIGKGQGKAQYTDPYSNTNPTKVDMYSLMTFKPLTPAEFNRTLSTWNDAPKQPRKKLPENATAAAGTAPTLQQLIAAGAAQPVRFVPYGGIAQERGMTLDAIIANRKHFKR